MQDFRYVGLDILTQAASTRRYSFLFLSQLAYNSEILSKLLPFRAYTTDNQLIIHSNNVYCLRQKKIIFEEVKELRRYLFWLWQFLGISNI